MQYLIFYIITLHRQPERITKGKTNIQSQILIARYTNYEFKKIPKPLHIFSKVMSMLNS